MEYSAKHRAMRDFLESLRTPAGGYTRETLKMLGVDWPPVKGWKKNLEARPEMLAVFQVRMNALMAERSFKGLRHTVVQAANDPAEQMRSGLDL